MNQEQSLNRNAPKSRARRAFLTRMSGATATAAIGAIGLWPLLRSKSSFVQAQNIEPAIGNEFDPDSYNAERDIEHEAGAERPERAFRIRLQAAQRERNLPLPAHLSNGDEDRYPRRIGNFSKGLIHNSRGEVDRDAYNALLHAIKTRRFADFEALQAFQGCPDRTRQRPFVNLEAANGFNLEGTDSAQLIPLPPAPRFDSAERAAEMAELYWMALLRDVNFDEYATNPTAQAAADDLSNLPGFKGPRAKSGHVTTRTLFRDPFPGCTLGPYISQFLVRQMEFGAQRIDQRIRPRAEGVDFLTDFTPWLDVQNGCQPDLLLAPPASVPFRFISNGRDIAQYVHLDLLYQAFFVATVMLLNGITLNETTSPFIFRFPFDRNNPYGQKGSTNVQAGFATFGNPHIEGLVTEASSPALKAVWFQKWRVHRALRPEEFGGRLEAERQGRANYPIHSDLTNRSTVLPLVLNRFGSYLLPQAHPEGAPLHPSYGAGHAVVAGACVTMLKAFFDEETIIPEPQEINPDDGGQTTRPYAGPDRERLTVGGELNKLASNISTGRNIAGVHWRSDAVEAIELGERVAISILSDRFKTFGEPFDGFTLTKFDETRVTIRDDPRV